MFKVNIWRRSGVFDVNFEHISNLFLNIKKVLASLSIATLNR